MDLSKHTEPQIINNTTMSVVYLKNSGQRGYKGTKGIVGVKGVKGDPFPAALNRIFGDPGDPGFKGDNGDTYHPGVFYSVKVLLYLCGLGKHYT